MISLKTDFWVRGLLLGLALLLMLYAGHVLSGSKQVKCSRARKVQILMVYPAYREVCDDDDYVDVDDHEEEEKEEDEKGDKEEETKCDQSGQPETRLIYDDLCTTTYIEDCVTKYDVMPKETCVDGLHKVKAPRRRRGKKAGLTSERRGISVPSLGERRRRRLGAIPRLLLSGLFRKRTGKRRGPPVVPRIKDILTPDGADDAHAGDDLSPQALRLVHVNEVAAGNREEESLAAAAAAAAAAAESCRTVYEVREERKVEERCEERKQRRCTTTKQERCHRVKETIHERRCVSVQRERCEATGQTLRRKVVVEEEECTTEFREHCMEPVIDFYVFIQGRCETLPEKKCKVVPKEKEVEEPQHVCRKVPSEECHSVPRQIPRRRCETVPVRKCREVPVRTCRQAKVRVPIRVARRVCGGSGGEDDGDTKAAAVATAGNLRPKREHQGGGYQEQRPQQHFGGAVRSRELPAGCKVEYHQVPRLQCTRIPKTNCQRVAKEVVTKSKGTCKESDGGGDSDGDPKGRSRKRGKNCRRVGVGQPRRVPRVTPTVVCNVG